MLRVNFEAAVKNKRGQTGDLSILSHPGAQAMLRLRVESTGVKNNTRVGEDSQTLVQESKPQTSEQDRANARAARHKQRRPEPPPRGLLRGRRDPRPPGLTHPLQRLAQERDPRGAGGGPRHGPGRSGARERRGGFFVPLSCGRRFATLRGLSPFF